MGQGNQSELALNVMKGILLEKNAWGQFFIIDISSKNMLTAYYGKATSGTIS